MIMDGALVPMIGIGLLAVLWAIVLYGSRFFGPR
jgi:hypothetical protein